MADRNVTRHDSASTEMQRLRSLSIANVERHDWDNNLVFVGEKECLRLSGLVPEGTQFPDECDAKRGVRWRSASGRRFVLTRGWGPAGTFRLTVFAMPVEKKHVAHAARVARDIKEIDRSIQSLDLSENEFRESMRRLIPAVWRTVRDGHYETAWVYSPEVMRALQDRFDDIHVLLTAGDLERNDDRLNKLKTQRAALQNDQLQGWIASLSLSRA